MANIVTDSIAYAKVSRVIRGRDSYYRAGRVDELTETCGSEEASAALGKATKISMGTDTVQMDMANVDRFADAVQKKGTEFVKVGGAVIRRRRRRRPPRSPLAGAGADGTGMLSAGGAATDRRSGAAEASA